MTDRDSTDDTDRAGLIDQETGVGRSLSGRQLLVRGGKLYGAPAGAALPAPGTPIGTPDDPWTFYGDVVISGDFKNYIARHRDLR
jgi:hypothetical protein